MMGSKDNLFENGRANEMMLKGFCRKDRGIQSRCEI